MPNSAGRRVYPMTWNVPEQECRDSWYEAVAGPVTPLVMGLQTAIDVLPVTRGRGVFYVLEYRRAGRLALDQPAP